MEQKKIKQIPPHIGWYIAGFADGEGSFNVSLKKDTYTPKCWHVEPSFNISQRDITVLALAKQHLGVGSIRMRKDGVYYYEVRNYRSLYDCIIPFFQKYHFLSATKKKNFSIFKQIIEIMNRNEHTTPNGFQEILELRERLNEGRGRKRKYSLNDYLNSQMKSSETIRQTSK